MDRPHRRGTRHAPVVGDQAVSEAENIHRIPSNTPSRPTFPGIGRQFVVQDDEAAGL